MPNIYISADFEGPFGMYSFINSSHDLARYHSLDNVFRQLISIHHRLHLPLTVATLAVVCLPSVDSFIKLFPNHSIYPETSLVHKFFHDYSFFNLVIKEQSAFFKYHLIKELIPSLDPSIIKFCSHSLSHVHFAESFVSSSCLLHELLVSFYLLSKTIPSEFILNSLVLPRNQLSNDLIVFLEGSPYRSVRLSSKLRLFSENHDSGTLQKFYWKFLRYFFMISNSKIPSHLLQNTSLPRSELSNNKCINFIDSGLFIRFPKTSRSGFYVDNFRYIKSYINHSVKFSNDISLWYHPHNLLDNPQKSLILYNNILEYLLTNLPSNYRFCFL